MILYDHLFSYVELQRALSAESCLDGILRFEAALAKAAARAGLIPPSAADTIAHHCRVENFDLASIPQPAAIAGNLAIPIVKALTEIVARHDKDAARFVHWGATSQDAIDTSLVLQLRDVLHLVEKDMARLCHTLAALASQHRDTIVVARTWMQQALPTTFGFIVAGWLDALLRQRRRLAEIRPRVLSLQFGGAAGTLAALRGEGPSVAKLLAGELQLTLPEIPWHTSRDRIAETAVFFGLLAGTLGKIARDISLHAQTEVAELSEPSRQGRGSSSTMPHKRNPITCAMVLAAATRVPSLVSTVLSAMPQEQQRGLGGWQAEWETLPEILRLTGGALHHLAEMLPPLQVHTQHMQQNLHATNGLIFAEAISMALADRMGKMPAHLLLQAAAGKSREQHRNLKDVLREEPALHHHLTPADLEALFDSRNYLGNARDFVDQVVAEARKYSAIP